MKRCPECRRDYYDDTLLYCLDDGNALLEGPASGKSEPGTIATGFPADEPQTAILHETTSPSEAATRAQILTAAQTAVPPSGVAKLPTTNSFDKKLLLAPVALVVIVLGGFFGYRYFNAANSGEISSIAVLPFENRSNDPDADYLSDGLAESLIYRLSQLPNLKVSPTSSVMRYKGQGGNLKTIADELGVRAVMTGRVVQRGDNLSISIELIDVLNNKLLWGEQYERKLSELLTTQREIAAEITNKLQLKLSGVGEQKLAKKYTDNNEAYQLYLKGRFQWNRRTPESLKQAVALFEQGIEKDPNFALAYSALAESYVLFPNFSISLPQESMPRAKAAALRALEIDDTLAEARTALGIYYSNYAWNQAAAEKEFRRAIELNPNYATAHHEFGIECLTAAGRFEEAIIEGREAERLDPFSLIIGADLGNILIRARRFDEAIKQLNKVLTLDPNFYVGRYYLAAAYQANGQFPEAVSEYRKAMTLNDDPWVRAQLIRSLAKSGQRVEAEKLLRELQSDATRRYVSSASLALAFAGLGDKDNAFALLEKEVTERTPRPSLFSVNPLWDDLRDDPRFADLLRKVEQAKLD